MLYNEQFFSSCCKYKCTRNSIIADAPNADNYGWVCFTDASLMGTVLLRLSVHMIFPFKIGFSYFRPKTDNEWFRSVTPRCLITIRTNTMFKKLTCFVGARDCATSGRDDKPLITHKLVQLMTSRIVTL